MASLRRVVFARLGANPEGYVIWLVVLQVVLAAIGMAIYSSAILAEGLGFSVGATLLRIFRSDARRWAAPLSLAYFGAVVFAWSIPANPLRQNTYAPMVFQILLAISAVMGAGLVVRELGGSDTRPLAWICVIVAMGVAVAYFSSSVGGAGPMLEWLMRHGMSSDQAHLTTFLFRKTVHFSFYGTLGIAGSFAAQRIELGPVKSGMIGLFIVLLTAGFDELRQSSQPGRTGNIYDVILDIAGATVFVSLALCGGRFVKSRQNP